MQKFDSDPRCRFRTVQYSTVQYSTVQYCPIIMDGTRETSAFSPMTASDPSPLNGSALSPLIASDPSTLSVGLTPFLNSQRNHLRDFVIPRSAESVPAPPGPHPVSPCHTPNLRKLPHPHIRHLRAAQSPNAQRHRQQPVRPLRFRALHLRGPSRGSPRANPIP